MFLNVKASVIVQLHRLIVYLCHTVPVLCCRGGAGAAGEPAPRPHDPLLRVAAAQDVRLQQGGARHRAAPPRRHRGQEEAETVMRGALVNGNVKNMQNKKGDC